jgi:phage-related protein (TIGR01555 family)
MGRRKRRGKQIVLPAVQNSKAVIPEVITNAADADATYGGLPTERGVKTWNMGFGWTGFDGMRANQLSEPGTLFESLRFTLVTNYRQMLNQAFAELGLVQTIVKVPVEDALRGGINISTAQLSEEEIAELVSFREEQGDDETAGEAAEWNRLFGGSGIIIFTDQDPETPLDIDAIRPDDNVEFRAVDMWELHYDRTTIDDYDTAAIDPLVRYYDYYGERIHKSRVIPMKGIKPPSFLRPRLRGWGVSCIETLVSGINQYLKAANLTYEVLDEFKVDIYRVANFASASFGPSGGAEGSVKDRVELVNWQKNYQNAIVLDKEDEYESKQISFAGLAEAQAGVRMQIASDMRMPLTKLFGMSSAGFNSGEDDIEVYNGMIESSVRGKLKRPIMLMVKIRCQQLFGFIPDDLKIDFKPLRVLSSTDEETVKTSQFNRALAARQAGEITAEAFADICNRSNLFPIKITAAETELMVDGDDDMEDDRDSLSDLHAETGEDGNGDTNEDEEFEDMRGPVKKPAKLSVVNTKQKSKKQPVFTVLPKPYSAAERMRRALNSRTFDLKSYEADGGDAWIDPRRRYFFEDPGSGVDQMLWTKARIASKEALGEIRWQFVAWMYKKLGGRFEPGMERKA